MGGPSQAELDAAIFSLFKAYDIDESGELSRDEFLKIQMRLCFDTGEVFKKDKTAVLTLADKDRSGNLDFEEFRETTLRLYSEMQYSKAESIKKIHENVKAVLTERVKMGPRFHAGIRQALKRIFSLYDTSG